MCRQGGYYEQAAYLATKHNEHEVVVDILIEDSKMYKEALEYIWRLEAESVCFFLHCCDSADSLGVFESYEICPSTFGALPN